MSKYTAKDLDDFMVKVAHSGHPNDPDNYQEYDEEDEPLSEEDIYEREQEKKLDRELSRRDYDMEDDRTNRRMHPGNGLDIR